MSGSSHGASPTESLKAAVAALESPAPERELAPLSEEGSAATKAALRLLKFRARSEHELRKRLAEKEFAAEAVAEAMDRVEAWKLLDDADFAREWVRQRSVSKGATRTLLRRELREKGVGQREIAEAVSEVSEDAEIERAHSLIRERIHRREGTGLAGDAERRAKATRRLVAFLQRRGYAPHTALSVVDAEVAAYRDFLGSGRSA